MGRKSIVTCVSYHLYLCDYMGNEMVYPSLSHCVRLGSLNTISIYTLKTFVYFLRFYLGVVTLTCHQLTKIDSVLRCMSRKAAEIKLKVSSMKGKLSLTDMLFCIH